MNRGLITISEAAQLKGVSRSVLYRAIERGDLTAREILGLMAVRQKDVLAWEPRRSGRRKGSTTSEVAKSRISQAQKERWERVKVNRQKQDCGTTNNPKSDFDRGGVPAPNKNSQN